MFHRTILILAALACVAVTADFASAQPKKAQKFARIAGDKGAVYALVEGDNLRVLSGDLFGEWKTTDQLVPIAKAKFLAATDPRNVYGLAGNYQDHIAGLEPEKLEKFKIPQFFVKTHACLCGHGDNILYPPDAGRLDPEGELVIVIGKAGRNIPKEKALDYVFGVTTGNDMGARDWQKNDIQWWRAKGSETFGPCGPFIATGVDYDNLDMTTTVNGKVRIKTNTKMMVHNTAAIVSFLSKHVTIQPGDLIFTGTAGKTEPIQVGDEIEIEIQNVGVLRNKVAAGK